MLSLRNMHATQGLHYCLIGFMRVAFRPAREKHLLENNVCLREEHHSLHSPAGRAIASSEQ